MNNEYEKFTKWLLIVFVYVWGYVTAYLDVKDSIIQKYGHYTISDRNTALFVSSLSWISFGML